MTAAIRSAADTGYKVMVWNVNLLTRPGAIRPSGGGNAAGGGNVASLTCWMGALMRHAVTNWNKFVDIACAHRPPPHDGRLAARRVTVTNKAARTLKDDTTIGCAS